LPVPAADDIYSFTSPERIEAELTEATEKLTDQSFNDSGLSVCNETTDTA